MQPSCRKQHHKQERHLKQLSNMPCQWIGRPTRGMSGYRVGILSTTFLMLIKIEFMVSEARFAACALV